MIFGFLKERRRRRLRAQAISPAWRSILERNMPIFRRLPREDQTELLEHVQIFLAEKRFEGCGGLKLTDEIRVTIAAQACLLILHRKTDYYPQLITILVYPSGYTAHEKRYLEGNIWAEVKGRALVIRRGDSERWCLLGEQANGALQTLTAAGTWCLTGS